MPGIPSFSRAIFPNTQVMKPSPFSQARGFSIKTDDKLKKFAQKKIDESQKNTCDQSSIGFEWDRNISMLTEEKKAELVRKGFLNPELLKEKKVAPPDKEQSGEEASLPLPSKEKV